MEKIAVQQQRQHLALGTEVCLYVFGQPGFNPASLVVISPAAADGKIFPGFESIDEKIPDVVAAFLKGLD